MGVAINCISRLWRSDAEEPAGAEGGGAVLAELLQEIPISIEMPCTCEAINEFHCT